MKGCGFFHDSTGARSYGRLASFLLVLGGILLGVAGRDYGAMLTAAVGFYATSKSVQSVEAVWGKDEEKRVG